MTDMKTKVENDQLREALRDVRAAIMEADPAILIDTLWMPDHLLMGATVVDAIDLALGTKP